MTVNILAYMYTPRISYQRLLNLTLLPMIENRCSTQSELHSCLWSCPAISNQITEVFNIYDICPIRHCIKTIGWVISYVCHGVNTKRERIWELQLNWHTPHKWMDILHCSSKVYTWLCWEWIKWSENDALLDRYPSNSDSRELQLMSRINGHHPTYVC